VSSFELGWEQEELAVRYFEVMRELRSKVKLVE